MTLTALSLACGCSEISKLIPTSPDPIPAGLRSRDFRSSYSPAELIFDGREDVYGLSNDVAASVSRFSELGLGSTQQDLEAFLDVASELQKHRFLSSDPDQNQARGFLSGQPALPKIAEIIADLERFELETPNLKSNIAVILDPVKEAPLVYRARSPVFEHDPTALETAGFKLYRAPKAVFSGISNTFNPDLRTALQAGITDATEVLFDEYQAISVESILAYGRSLQPDNEFQAVLECARVHLSAPAPAADSPSSDLPERGPWELSLVWPRVILWEESASMIDRSVLKPGQISQGGSTKTSTMTMELRPSAVVAATSTSDEPGSRGPVEWRVSLQPAPISIEARLIRTPDTINLYLSRHPYDGANQSESYSLFHEAKRFFHFRFASAVTTVTDVRFVLSSFQIPYAIRHFEARSMRNEEGQWRNALSDSQSDFFLSESGNDGLSAPPDDLWTTATPIQIFRSDNTPGRLNTEPETAPGALHHLDPKALAQSFAQSVLTPTYRRKTKDSSLAEEEYDALETLCRSYFQGKE